MIPTEIRHESLGPLFQKDHMHLGNDVWIVLHRFTAPDVGDPHDHPWSFTSMIAKGSYVEEIFERDGTSRRVLRKRGDTIHVEASRIHRIVDLPEGECVTAVLYGPKEMDVSFYQFREDGTYRRLASSDQWVKEAVQ